MTSQQDGCTRRVGSSGLLLLGSYKQQSAALVTYQPLPTVVGTIEMIDNYVGTWRITEMELWDQDFIDLVSPGQVMVYEDGRGSLNFGAVEIDMDCTTDKNDRNNRIAFTFLGFDEGGEVSGNGWVKLHGNHGGRDLLPPWR